MERDRQNRHYIYKYQGKLLAKLAGGVEYTDCFSTAG